MVIDMIRSFAFAGTELTMTAFNKAGKMPPTHSRLTSKRFFLNPPFND